MAAKCSAIFARLGLDPPNAIAITAPFPKLIRRAIDKRAGAREAFRLELARMTRKLWDGGAMPFNDTRTAAQVVQAIATALVPDVPQPKLDYASVVNLAREQKAVKDNRAPTPATEDRGPRSGHAGGRATATADSRSKGQAASSTRLARSRSPRASSHHGRRDRSISPRQPPRHSGSQGHRALSARVASVTEDQYGIDVACVGPAHEARAMAFFLGHYETMERTCHNKAVYKLVPSGSNSHDGAFMYYWDGRDGYAHQGWWISVSVGGSKVYAHNEYCTEKPPVEGWRYPHDEDTCPDLLVMASQPGPVHGETARTRGRSRTPPRRQHSPTRGKSDRPKSPNTLVGASKPFLAPIPLTKRALPSNHYKMLLVLPPPHMQQRHQHEPYAQIRLTTTET